MMQKYILFSALMPVDDIKYVPSKFGRSIPQSWLSHNGEKSYFCADIIDAHELEKNFQDMAFVFNERIKHD